MKTRLLQSAREYLDLIKSLVVVRSPAGKVEYVNERVCFLLGYERKEMVGKDWFRNFTSKNTQSATRSAFQKGFTREAGANRKREEFVQGKNGETFLVEWLDNYLKDQEGKVIGVLSSGEDVTEKQLLRESLLRQRIESRKELMQAVLEAAERERQKIAYELHDGVNQVLTVCKLLVEQQLMAFPEQKGRLSEVSGHLLHAITEIRRISHRLNPAGLGTESLYEAARELLARVNRTHKISVREKITGVKYLKGLEAGTALSLYRILQEAMTNIIRHAKASQVKVVLIGSEWAVELEIEDDGVGFIRREAAGSGLGLKNIYTRAEALGGKAYVSSAPGEGTVLSVHVPL